VRRWNHHQLSTFGLLKEMQRKNVTSVIYQLIDAGLLERTPGDRPVLKLNAASWEVMRGKRQVKLLEPRKSKPAKTAIEQDTWRDVDEKLFEDLRALRRQIASERGVAAFVILHDSTLREMARQRPTTVEALREVRGMGEKKIADFGSRFVEFIASNQPGKIPAAGADRAR
jgi:ATP-dependent DNA helicase RecQ